MEMIVGNEVKSHKQEHVLNKKFLKNKKNKLTFLMPLFKVGKSRER